MKTELTLKRKPPAAGRLSLSLDIGGCRRAADQRLHGLELGVQALLPAPEAALGEVAGGLGQALAPRRVAGEAGQRLGDEARLARRQEDARLVVADQLARRPLVDGEDAAAGR